MTRNNKTNKATTIHAMGIDFSLRYRPNPETGEYGSCRTLFVAIDFQGVRQLTVEPRTISEGNPQNCSAHALPRRLETHGQNQGQPTAAMPVINRAAFKLLNTASALMAGMLQLEQKG